MTTNVENGRWVTASCFWAKPKPKHCGNELRHHSRQVISSPSSSSSSRLRILLSQALMLGTRAETCQLLWCWIWEACFQFSAEFSGFNVVWSGCFYGFIVGDVLTGNREEDYPRSGICIDVWLMVYRGSCDGLVSVSDFSRYLTHRVMS